MFLKKLEIWMHTRELSNKVQQLIHIKVAAFELNTTGNQGKENCSLNFIYLLWNSFDSPHKNSSHLKTLPKATPLREEHLIKRLSRIIKKTTALFTNRTEPVSEYQFNDHKQNIKNKK